MTKSVKSIKGVLYVSWRTPIKDHFIEILEKVKEIPGRAFVKKTSSWTVPETNFNIKKLNEIGFDIQDANINKKRFTNIKPIEIEGLYNFQKIGVGFLEMNNGSGLIADEMGCIDGDAIITVSRGGNSRKYKLLHAYRSFNNLSNIGWDGRITSYIRCLKDGRFGLHPIKEILYKGKKLTYEVTTKSNKKLIMTPDHELLTKDGWISLEDLNVGDAIIVNGTDVCPTCGTTKDIITYKYSKNKGYCKSCMYKYLRKNRNIFYDKKHKHNDGYVYLRGKRYNEHPRYSSSGLLEHIFIMENRIGRPLQKNEQVHHINENRSDNRDENLQLVTIQEHKKIHKTEKHFGNFRRRNGSQVVTIPKEEKIKMITLTGEREVYDIVMEDPHRNFVANGIVVHNCGKTAQALSYLKIHPELRPAIIVVPASLKLNWEREIEKWTDEGAFIINGKKPLTEYYRGINIINYDILNDHVDKFKEIDAKIIIGDEVHKCKNPKAIRTKAFMRLVKGRKFIAMSGTPILNKPIELFTTLHMLKPKLFPSRWAFARRYCDLKNNGFGWTMNGATNMEELHEILTEDIMIRRLKKDVLKELPAKQISVVPMKMERKYFIEETTLLENADVENRMGAIAVIEKLKQLAVEYKMKQAMKWINDFIENEEKIVVFCTHHKTIDKLMEIFRGLAVKLDGRDSQTKKQEAVDKFQTDTSIKLFVGNIIAAGVGITLTAASNVVFMELGWTPGDHVQCEDRCHRIGQEDSVNVYYLIAQNTIEDDIVEMLDHKRNVLDQILDGKETEKDSMLGVLIKKYNLMK